MKIVLCAISSIATGMEYKTCNEDYKTRKYRGKGEFTYSHFVSHPDILCFKVFLCLGTNILRKPCLSDSTNKNAHSKTNPDSGT